MSHWRKQLQPCPNFDVVKCCCSSPSQNRYHCVISTSVGIEFGNQFHSFLVTCLGHFSFVVRQRWWRRYRGRWQRGWRHRSIWSFSRFSVLYSETIGFLIGFLWFNTSIWCNLFLFFRHTHKLRKIGNEKLEKMQLLWDWLRNDWRQFQPNTKIKLKKDDFTAFTLFSVRVHGEASGEAQRKNKQTNKKAKRINSFCDSSCPKSEDLSLNSDLMKNPWMKRLKRKKI